MRFRPTARYPRASIQSSQILLEILHPAAGLWGSLTLPLTHAHTCTHMQDTAQVGGVGMRVESALMGCLRAASSQPERTGSSAPNLHNNTRGRAEGKETPRRGGLRKRGAVHEAEAWTKYTTVADRVSFKGRY